MDKKFHYKEFEKTEQLVQRKIDIKCSISVVLPALNEAATVGSIIAYIHQSFVQKNSLIDEIIVIDGGSDDGTAEAARTAGALVYQLNEIMPNVQGRGKGIALWKSLFVAKGDIILFIDSDILEFDKRFVNGLLGPLLFDETICFTKSFYKRPLIIGSGTYENYGGRVTEILVRPMLAALLPELSQIIQPLAGEYAIRKSVAEQIPFWSGYGVEIGLLFDLLENCGMSGIAQVDMDYRHHRNRSVIELGKMSFGILHVMFSKLERLGILKINKQLGQTLGYYNDPQKDTYYYEEIELPPKVDLIQSEFADANT